MGGEQGGDEPKIFPPSPEFQKSAYYSSRSSEYEAAYKRSVEDPEGFWLSAPRTPSSGT